MKWWNRHLDTRFHPDSYHTQVFAYMYTLAAYAVYLVYVVTVMFFSPIDVGQVGQIAALHFQSLLMVSVPSKITQGPKCLKNRFYSQVIQPKQHTKSTV